MLTPSTQQDIQPSQSAMSDNDSDDDLFMSVSASGVLQEAAGVCNMPCLKCSWGISSSSSARGATLQNLLAAAPLMCMFAVSTP